ncbi:DUF4156 domain-containing protein [Proteobacteria bacterium 005FR1]|nr:DUF4156 domain-containing protein [Proteobacteria bacterium 005FR1]
MRPLQLIKPVLILPLAFAGLAACTWVDLTPQGERVDLMTQEQAANCERVGQTTSQILDKIAFMDRSEEKKQEELRRLARNEAASMGGNAIVPATEITEGRQRFVVYRCP